MRGKAKDKKDCRGRLSRKGSGRKGPKTTQEGAEGEKQKRKEGQSRKRNKRKEKTTNGRKKERIDGQRRKKATK